MLPDRDKKQLRGKASSDDGDTANTSFENSPAFLLSTLGNRIALIAERNLRREFDLAYMEWQVIQIVGSEPGALPKRVVAVTGVNKANVSRAVNSLEQRGLLKRTSLAHHIRHTQLHLTKEGQNYYRRGNIMRAEAEDRFLGGLSETARRQLSNSLRRVMRNVDELRNADMD